MRITLFMPCFNDVLFPGTGMSTVRILESLGHQVSFPRDQTCCGQIHFNTGFRKEAASLMERFVQIFGDAEAVVGPSASCVAMVREQYRELARDLQDGGLRESVGQVAEKTFELSEFLVGELGVEDLGAHFPYRVAFHPTCHSIRSLHLGDAPLQLLRAVRGLELRTLEGVDECCGFGGTFAVKNPHTSLAMMEDKIRSVRESGAQVLTAVDNSCLLHLAGGMRRMGHLWEGPDDSLPPPKDAKRIKVMHMAEILASREEGVGL